MDKTDILIIGAGVIGLAAAAELATRYRSYSITILERNSRFGLETSSRSSEVIHSGIYYPPGSLKARLCAEGNPLLYRFCEKWDIPHRRTGKLIVAGTDEEIPALEKLAIRAEENGVPGIRLLTGAGAARLEPAIRARAALFSPFTGIIDSYKLMSSLEWQAAQAGVLTGYRHEATGFERGAGGYLVHYLNPDRTGGVLACDRVINCAGLEAGLLASRAGIDIEKAGYRVHLCKGEYFSVDPAKAGLISRLIYPPPPDDLKGLGIHFTKSLDGRARLGPNATYVEKVDYTVDPSHAAQFFREASAYLPFLEITDLEPEMAGIRPKLQGPGQPFRDFVIQDEAALGLPGFINLVGIESPGLSSCLSIGKKICELAG